MGKTSALPVNADSLLCSFAPFVDKKSQILILGSMPGPEALRKQQYYGFQGNHFWTIIPRLVGVEKPTDYEEKLTLLRTHNIALWDVLASCIRPGALDSAIREAVPNKIPELLEKFPNIQAVFVNGRYAFGMFEKCFKNRIQRPYFYLPSTSPAHAAMTLEQKVQQWAVIKKYLI